MSARVLVVDDVLPNVKLLEAKLTSEYFDVLCATSGEEALSIIARTPPDIILLDVMMPGMDGFEVCRRIKADPRSSHIPVIMVTALDHPRDRVTGLEAGADDFLTKPVHDVALFARVRSLVRLKMLTDELVMREVTSQSLGFRPDGPIMNAGEIEDAFILLVEDQERSANRLAEAMIPVGRVELDLTGESALERATAGGHDLVVISLGLAAVDGLRICSQLRSIEETRHVPILVIVDESNSRELMRGLEIGVNDYLVRPIDRNELVARVRTQVRRKRYAEQLRKTAHQNYRMATTDAVTGLYNRHFMTSHLETLLQNAEQSGRTLSVMMMDIDYFKRINDSYGHAAGDQVLRDFAQRISRNIRGIDLAARFGGEEFVVIMPETDTDFAVMVAERLRAAIEQEPFHINTTTSQAVTVSLGIACTAGHPASLESLIARADAALYQAKNEGRNRVVVARD
ncbi:PleD family two-component system response regulator [Govanella unica]|uniref:diguanylate cyclase n=1 Tax=Govanella unica TaxID=2975056 RepID=A0A9X3Z6K4_9PROT|nr:PleD family two-component system response regulator [Govania unica]MDA5193113.1 PleD family two-component system response regulator [Govania unica]